MLMAVTLRTGGLSLLLCSLVGVISCDVCGDDLKSTSASTDAQLVAHIYERNCGVTTDFSAMVNVQSASVRFNGDEGILFVAKGRFDLSVEWTGPRTLLIKCSTCSRKDIFRQLVALGDVDVKYVLLPMRDD